MIEALSRYLFLPSEITEFEDAYLKRTNRIAMIFFALHLPALVLMAWLNETGPAMALLLTTAGLIGPLLAMKFFQSRRAVSVVFGFTMVYMCGLLIHFGQGPVQIEMHFYFFVGLALLSVFGNPMVILTATATVAVHHIGLYFLLPASVFNYEASLLVLSTHVIFALCGCVASVFLGRTFHDNVIGLERMVATRTSEVEARNADMRMILNSVREGFLTIGPDQCVRSERSLAVTSLFGDVQTGDRLPDIVGRHDQRTAEWLEFGLDEVFNGLLPVEVSVDQLPSRTQANGRQLSLHFLPIKNDNQIAFLTVVINDITAEIEREKLEAESRQMLTMIERISKDRNGFLEFMHEANVIIEDLRHEARNDLARLRRMLHTLKGNAAIFGLHQLTDACHALEDQLIESPEIREGRLWTHLFSSWSRIKANLRRLVTVESKQFQLTDAQYNELLLGLLNREPPEILAPKLAVWKLDPTENRLKTIASQARRVAKNLGKGNIDVRVTHNGLRTESATWSGFWGTMVHVVNNAVDHGLESIEDRRLAGKSDVGKIRLSTYCEKGKFIVSVSDDGRGIDWNRIRELAQIKGLPTQRYTDLVDALFVDGLSTKAETTAISGRGVGMAAIKQICTDLNGLIEVTSEPGKGTEIQFVFPIEEMAPKTHQLFKSYGVKADFQSLLIACRP